MDETTNCEDQDSSVRPEDKPLQSKLHVQPASRPVEQVTGLGVNTVSALLRPHSKDDEQRTDAPLTTISRTDQDEKEPEPVSFRSRAISTVTLFFCILFLGLVDSLIGSTYVDLQLYLNCGTRSISLALPLQSIGVMLGSCVAIFKLNRLAPELSLGLSMICYSIVSMIVASVPSIYWFLTFTALQGFVRSIYMSDMQPYCIRLWANHRFKDPVVHSVHALQSLGLSIGPFIITLFLVKSASLPNSPQYTATTEGLIPSRAQTTPSYIHTQWTYGERPQSYTVQLPTYVRNHLTGIFQGHDWNMETTTETTFLNVVGNTTPNQRESISSVGTNATKTNATSYTGHVQYAYVVLSLPVILSAAILIYLFFRTGESFLRKIQKQEERNIERNGNTLATVERRIVITLFAMMYFFHIIVEIVPPAFFTLFVSKHLDWPTPQRTLINSAYFGFFCLGRFLGIPLSSFAKSRTILFFNVAIPFLAACMLLASERSDMVVWVATGLLGFGMSTIFGTVSLWFAENVVPFTRRIMAIGNFSMAAGVLVGPTVVGQLFVAFTPMFVVYTVIIAAVTDIALFVAILVLEMRRERRRSSDKSLPIASVNFIEGPTDVCKPKSVETE